VGLLCQLLAPRAAWAQLGTGVLTGRVVDVSTQQPVVDVVVTATSPALQGEQIVVTDASGTYRIPNLPPGLYEAVLVSKKEVKETDLVSGDWVLRFEPRSFEDLRNAAPADPADDRLFAAVERLSEINLENYRTFFAPAVFHPRMLGMSWPYESPPPAFGTSMMRASGPPAASMNRE
jgi:hypothetical protein